MKEVRHKIIDCNSDRTEKSGKVAILKDKV